MQQLHENKQNLNLLLEKVQMTQKNGPSPLILLSLFLSHKHPSPTHTPPHPTPHPHTHAHTHTTPPSPAMVGFADLFVFYGHQCAADDLDKLALSD